MANELKMAEIHAIEQLWKQGWSCRKIARELGIYRDTVRKYVRQLEAKPANVTPGKSADLSPSGALSAISDPSKPATQVTPGFSRSKSRCEQHRETILAKLELGLSARRIFQDLRGEHGFKAISSTARGADGTSTSAFPGSARAGDRRSPLRRRSATWASGRSSTSRWGARKRPWSPIWTGFWARRGSSWSAWTWRITTARSSGSTFPKP